jgi:hypothetical protein
VSAIEDAPSGQSIELDDLPSYELSYLFDDEDEPTEVTVFPASDEFDISTNWITAGVQSTIPNDQIR